MKTTFWPDNFRWNAFSTSRLKAFSTLRDFMCKILLTTETYQIKNNINQDNKRVRAHFPDPDPDSQTLHLPRATIIKGTSLYFTTALTIVRNSDPWVMHQECANEKHWRKNQHLPNVNQSMFSFCLTVAWYCRHEKCTVKASSCSWLELWNAVFYGFMSPQRQL